MHNELKRTCKYKMNGTYNRETNDSRLQKFNKPRSNTHTHKYVVLLLEQNNPYNFIQYCVSLFKYIN